MSYREHYGNGNVFFKCVNFGNGNGEDLAGMGGIGNTEKHCGTCLGCSDVVVGCRCAAC